MCALKLVVSFVHQEIDAPGTIVLRMAGTFKSTGGPGTQPPERFGDPASRDSNWDIDGHINEVDSRLAQPINRRNATNQEDTLEDRDSDGDLNGPDEIDLAAQPHDDSWVSSDMSALTLNPGNSGVDQRSASTWATESLSAQELHLNGNFGSLDDAAIMLELKAGNMAAFDVLIHKYRKPIVSFMYRMTRNQATAEELAQEVFLRVYRSRETYRAEAKFSTWVYRIATNLGVNHARDTRHERTASTVYLDQADAETGTTPDVADTTISVESRLVRDERMTAIRDFVLALPERQKMAVLMHKYENMDYKQIGDVLKLSESATKSLLFRAYQTLREKLKGFV